MTDNVETKSNNVICGMMGSYNSNSLPQLNSIQSSISSIQCAIDVVEIVSLSSPIILADFGCSHGANSIYAMKTIIDLIKQFKRTERSVLVVHNDLPTNDWTSLFNILSKDKSYSGLANSCSFYSQCLPSNSVTISYSSSSIHWLSRKRCNLSNHCISLFCQREQREAFQVQAQLDYLEFLKHRSCELLPGDVLILGILGIDEEEGHHSKIEKGYDLLYQCAKLLPLNDEELLDYTIPMYRRTYKECCNEEIFNQCSLQLINSERYLTKSNVYEEYQQDHITLDQYAASQTDFIRSWSESSLKQTLQMNGKRSKEEIEELLNRFWTIYKEKVKEKPEEYNRSSWQTYLVLKKVKT